MIELLVALLLIAGAFFFTTATLGLLRFPDLYTRLHATGKGDTLGAGLILLGLVVEAGLSVAAVKLLFAAAFLLLTTPVATHTICRAAYARGFRPWKRR